MTTYFEGISKNGDDWKVVGNDNLQMILRNQGDHDRNFFIIDVMNEVEKAIEKAKYFCNR